MEKPKVQTPDQLIQEQIEILHAMQELSQIPAEDGNLYTQIDVQNQEKLIAEIMGIHNRIQVRLGRQAASDLAPTVTLAEVA